MHKYAQVYRTIRHDTEFSSVKCVKLVNTNTRTWSSLEKERGTRSSISVPFFEVVDAVKWSMATACVGFYVCACVADAVCVSKIVSAPTRCSILQSKSKKISIKECTT